MTRHRFEPNAAVIVRENAWVGLAIGLVMAGILYWAGDERGPVALIFGVGSGLFFFVFYVAIAMWQGLSTIEIDEKEVRVSNRRGGHVMRWSEVARYKHRSHRGREWWTLFSRHDRKKLQFYLHGYTSAGSTEIADAMTAHLAANGLTEPG